MKRQIRKAHLRVVGSLCCAMALCTPAMALESDFIATNEWLGKTISFTSSQHEVRVFEYEWKYKIVNGIGYKRLYNVTLQQWEGDWVLL